MSDHNPPTHDLLPHVVGGKPNVDSADENRRQKARERQRRKRAKDRESAGLPPPQPRDLQSVSVTMSRFPNREGETDEAKKARIREAARLRQRKHRHAVRMRRQQDLNNPQALPHEVYYGQELIQMQDGPDGQGPSPHAPSGAVFANTLMLALGCEPSLKDNLMRLYSIAEEEFPSLEQSFCLAFDHWNHARYAAHYGQIPRGTLQAAAAGTSEGGATAETSADARAAPASPNASSNIDGRLSGQAAGEGEGTGDDVDEIEDDAAENQRAREGSAQLQHQLPQPLYQPGGAVDPNDEHNKAWHALMQARMDVEARAAFRSAQLMQQQDQQPQQPPPPAH